MPPPNMVENIAPAMAPTQAHAVKVIAPISLHSLLWYPCGIILGWIKEQTSCHNSLLLVQLYHNRPRKWQVLLPLGFPRRICLLHSLLLPVVTPSSESSMKDPKYEKLETVVATLQASLETWRKRPLHPTRWSVFDHLRMKFMMKCYCWSTKDHHSQSLTEWRIRWIILLFLRSSAE